LAARLLRILGALRLPDWRCGVEVSSLESLAMPRQPFLPFILKNRNGQFDVGTHALRQRPELEMIIANCLMAWPNAEAQMAVLLALLLGATQSEASLALYQSLRRSSAQREALSETANIALKDSNDRELLNAILNAHKSVEAERNALTHGHFGTYSALTDGLIWMDTKTYLDTRTRLELAYQIPTEEFLRKVYDKTRIYKDDDLTSIYEGIKDIADTWDKFITYLRARGPDPPRDYYTAYYAVDRILPKSWRYSVVKNSSSSTRIAAVKVEQEISNISGAPSPCDTTGSRRAALNSPRVSFIRAPALLDRLDAVKDAGTLSGTVECPLRTPLTSR
jgi:hypothetical protein